MTKNKLEIKKSNCYIYDEEQCIDSIDEGFFQKYCLFIFDKLIEENPDYLFSTNSGDYEETVFLEQIKERLVDADKKIEDSNGSTIVIDKMQLQRYSKNYVETFMVPFFIDELGDEVELSVEDIYGDVFKDVLAKELQDYDITIVLNNDDNSWQDKDEYLLFEDNVVVTTEELKDGHIFEIHIKNNLIEKISLVVECNNDKSRKQLDFYLPFIKCDEKVTFKINYTGNARNICMMYLDGNIMQKRNF